MHLRPAAATSVALFGATALLLAGCSGGTDGGPSGDTATSAQNDREVVSIPVGQPFGEAQWSVNVDASSEQPPLVIGNHVVALSEGTVKAWSGDGTDAWQVPIPSTGESGEVALRQADANTVAVIATGMSEGEGLNESGFAAHVTLIDIPTGEATEVGIAGSDVDAPSLSAVGVAFTLPDGTGVIVTPEGETVDVPDVTTTTGPPNNSEVEDPILALGDTAIWATTEGDEEQTGYATDTWSTGDLDLLDYTLSSTIEAVDPALGLVVVGAHADEHVFAVVDAATGDVMSDIECKPDTLTSAFTSPNGEHSVVGPLRLSANDAQCVGGGEGQQAVTLTAVNDDGTAYGRASEGDLVIATADGGEPETSALPDGSNPPIGFLEGNLAVHYDAGQGIVTANPVG